MIPLSLIHKYNIPGPRYTSYPTVPYWKEKKIDKKKWQDKVTNTFLKSNHTEGISLYIHLPYCEDLCTFCACHKHITKQHSTEGVYINTLLKEWEIYLKLFKEAPFIKEIHLGGGTPTFFSPKNLYYLLSEILKKAKTNNQLSISFEAHPNSTSLDHLKSMYDLGSKRISFGIQDYSQKVQKAINRIQTFSKIEKINTLARKIGYTSINHDLVYGLPFQTIEDIKSTIEITTKLSPDRIALYSYAHVPWIKGIGQRGFSETDLPEHTTKEKMYALSKQMLEKQNFKEIGMDHFSKPTDSLYKALISKKIHRNFMGYTNQKTKLMIGLGMSSISDTWNAFAQNSKTIKEYVEQIKSNQLAVFRGHFLTPTDLIFRKYILDLMCLFEIKWDKTNFMREYPEIIKKIKKLEKDNLVIMEDTKLKVTKIGQFFIRNICMAFDLKLHENLPSKKVFSMTI